MDGTDSVSGEAAFNKQMGTSVAVYVCTFRRNEPLKRLLDSLLVASGAVQPHIEVAVVVVDDNPDGRASAVVDNFGHDFLRGLHYRHTGSRNISTARNMGLETAMELADWVAMTDDDQVVSPVWIKALFEAAHAHDADAITGPAHIRYEQGTPSWLDAQPFDEILEAQPRVDGERMDTCSTGNSMLKSSWLIAHPESRFRADLGRTGGEDMVFYRTAVDNGLAAFYSTEAEIFQMQPPERATFGYMVRVSHWLGNSAALSNLESGSASRPRLVLRHGKQLAQALLRPLGQLRSRQPAQLRFATAKAAQAAGGLVAVAGFRAKHI